MQRYVCIHGHFYQPPRENPWLEAIELQDSAYPYHDWNERITAECYAPNGASRILDSNGRIERIVNNYARISFNVGPTLLSWMEEHTPEAYRNILAADGESQQLFHGHGAALAQAYNHMILPLANRRDKETQILWGINDFEYRFGRLPEGMWLAETATDLETLDILAAYGIRFTILSPYQAQRVRHHNSDEWHDVSGGHIDPTMAYEQRLPSGRTITLFFYDAPISQGVAFEGLLQQGEHLAHRLVGAFSDDRPWAQLVHIATDGETYGHHHSKGDMALAYALHYIDAHKLATLTIYADYLDQHPPQAEVAIIEQSSWSCSHGIERWRNNCGCNSGMHYGWHQTWRAPLRQALDWLRDTVSPLYEAAAQQLFTDPWHARDGYISPIINRSPKTVERFFNQYTTRILSAEERVRALKLLELQRHAMLMFTSCGWFFDELSGIETVQIMQYAGRVIQLATDVFAHNNTVDTLETGFKERLQHAKSNIPNHRDGAHIYEIFVKTAMVNLENVLAHYAISSLFETYTQRTTIYSYVVQCHDCKQMESGGRLRLAMGIAEVTSSITHDSRMFCYGVIHLGDHNLVCGVRPYNANHYATMLHEVTEAFRRADLTDTIRLFTSYFDALTYSLKTLFRDEQRTILQHILQASLDQAEVAYRQVYNHNVALMRFLADLDIPLPSAFRTAADFVLNTDLQRAFAHEDIDITRIQQALDEAQRSHIVLDNTRLAYTFKETLEWMEQRLQQTPTDVPLLQKIDAFVGLMQTFPFEIDVWHTQNIYYDMLQTLYPPFVQRAQHGNHTAEEWVAIFRALGDKLGFRGDVLHQ